MSGTRAVARPPQAERAPGRRQAGDAHDAHEREADANAHAIARGGASCSVTPVRAPAADNGKSQDQRQAPPVPSSPGQTLDGVTRRFMQQRLGRDFGNVRIHADEAASRAAHEQQAHAYASGPDIVFGRGQYAPGTARGRMLLAHELTHVAQQAHLGPQARPVQRFSFGQFFARVFGEGTFTADELEVYLLRLESGRGIENDIDSDNKARDVVRKGMHKELALATRVLLIQEMLSGATGDDDERAILQILEDAPPLDREVIVERVGLERLDSKIDGDEHTRLLKIAAASRRSGKQTVPTTWTMSHAVSGASDVRPPPAIEVLALDATPEGEAAGRKVTGRQIVQSTSGSPQFLAGSFDHPRDKGGLGSLAFRALPTNEDNEPITENATAPEQFAATYAPVTYDKRLVNAHLTVDYEGIESPISTETSKQQSTEKSADTSKTSGQSTSATTATGAKKTSGTATTSGKESGQSTSKVQKKGTASTTSKSQTKGATEEKSQAHEEGASETNTTGKSSSDTTSSSGSTTKGESTTKSKETTKTESSESFKQINIDLDGTIEGNLGDILKSLTGKLIAGPVLDKFLDRAGKPGKILKSLIKKFNPIDMLLGGIGDSFTLKGTLKGKMAAEWETRKSESNTTGESTTKSSEGTTGSGKSHTGTSSSETATAKGTKDTTTATKGTSSSDTASKSDTASEESEKGSTSSSKTSKETSESTSTETSTSESTTTEKNQSQTQTKGTKEADATGTKITNRPRIPVIKGGILTFTVK